jgi:hypothetical protein
MTKITRVTQKQFGASGPSGDFGQFGSLAAGAQNYTKDPAVIQSLAAFLTGWAAETIATNRPALEDFNGLDYLVFYQICYLFQAGIAEWDPGTTYYANSFCQVAGVIYRSLVDTNINYNPTSEVTKWELAYDLSNYVALTGAQTVAGIKAFTSFPLTPSSDPTTDYQVANKKYVDGSVQVANYQTGALATGSMGIPLDDTIPQNNEGNQYLSVSITPKSATDKLKIDIVICGSSSGASGGIIAALFQDSNANALAAGYMALANNNYGQNLKLTYYMVAGTTSSTTFNVRAGVTTSDGGTFTLNGTDGSRLFGGVEFSSITVTEFKG